MTRIWICLVFRYNKYRLSTVHDYHLNLYQNLYQKVGTHFPYCAKKTHAFDYQGELRLTASFKAWRVDNENFKTSSRL